MGHLFPRLTLCDRTPLSVVAERTLTTEPAVWEKVVE